MNKRIVPVFVASVIAVIALIILAVGNMIEKNTPSKKQAGEEEINKLFLLYDGYTEDEKGFHFDNAVKAPDNQVAVILQNRLVRDRALIDENGQIYLDVEFVQNSLNSRFYWDNNENILIYTTPTDVIKTEVGSMDYYVTKVKNTMNYVIVKTEGQKVYVALDYVKQYSNIETAFYETPNRLCITNQWDVTADAAVIKSGDKVRVNDSIKSDILISYEEDMEAVILETVGKWSKIVTNDGYTGYIKTASLKNKTTKTYTSDFVEPEYTNIKKDFTISMAWHMVTNTTANNQLVDLVTAAKGLNVISPTWFRLNDNEGNFSSLAQSEYVTRAHLIGLEVWAMIDDQSPDSDNKAIFPYTSKRERLVNQLVASAIEYNLDGINIDFEYITADIAKDYVQFLRELSVKCRINGIVLSIDDKVPEASNLYYDRKEQGIIADYVIMMGYDEHWGEGSGAGSVASLPWVTAGIEKTLTEVPASKLINAIPFYTRIWQEDGAGNYVDSQAVDMQTAADKLTANGTQAVWVDNVGQNYGEFSAGAQVYRIWLEDAKSIEEKMKLIRTYNLAGVSAWRLGYENPDIWNTIIKYTN
ncbi:MAG: glycosyl hydrolase family 18 [Lachnospiraceae bacterium]|nr:glycosyl hydrolase family 18 [Lachnospiraceae bacterium]